MTSFNFDSFSIEAFKATLFNRGYQRSDRYIFNFPNEAPLGLTTALDENRMSLREFNEHMNRRTTKVSPPSQTLATNSIVTSGIDYENPYKLNFNGEFEFTFINDNEAALIKVFKSWIDSIFNKTTGNFEYRNDYISDIAISATDTTGAIKHTYSIKEMYPKSYTVSEFSSDTALQEVSVTMVYKYFDITLDAPASINSPLQSGVDFADFGGSTPQFPGDGTAFA
jgi:hypothetical protein|tara:strand:+ start:766 stop:1440 length:675 start_codon:yes stop_codon:yes gene_type:complete